MRRQVGNLSDHRCRWGIAPLIWDEAGQALAEYGLMIALIAVVCIGAIGLFGGRVAQILGPLP